MKFRFHNLGKTRETIDQKSDYKLARESAIDEARRMQQEHDDHGDVIVGRREDLPCISEESSSSDNA